MGASNAAAPAGAAGAAPRDLVAELPEQTVAGPVRALRRQEHRGAALVHVADALERPLAPPEVQQCAEALLVGGVLEWLVAAEDGRKAGPLHERGEDEIDEAAFVAGAAPVVEPARRVLMEGAVAAPERAVVLGQLRELPGHPQFAARTEIREHGETGTDGVVDPLLEGTFELVALGPLMVHGATVDHEGGDRGRPLVGQHHRIVPVQHGLDDGDGGDDRGHRHVPVQEAQLPRTGDERIEGASDVDDREPGDGSGILDRREAVPGRVHDEERRVGVVRHQRVHGHDGVDAAAEGDEGAPGFRLVGSGPAGRRVRADQVQGVEVDLVAIGELAEAVHVEVGEEGALVRRRRMAAQVDGRGGRRLVVRHASDEEEEAQRAQDGLVVPRPVWPEREVFGERMASGRVPAGHRSRGGVDEEPVVAELVVSSHGRWGGGPWDGPLCYGGRSAGAATLTRRAEPAARTARRAGPSGR